MLDFINRLKNKSEKEKHFIALGTSFVFTAIVFFFWVNHFFGQIHLGGLQNYNSSDLASVSTIDNETTLITETYSPKKNNPAADDIIKKSVSVDSPFSGIVNLFKDFYHLVAR